MSMLTGQADELRKAALIQGAHARYDVANLLTDAADTILSLRDRAQDLQAENAKLRELVRDMFGIISRNNSWWDGTVKDTRRLSERMHELGIEVDK